MTYPAWAAMGLVLLATALLPKETVSRIAPYPFALSLVFLGLPHGSWDHRVVAAARGTRLSWQYLALVCAIYSLLVLLYGALWFAAPSLAFVSFMIVSWLHWGQGDAAYLIQPHSPPAWLTWLVRGGAPILLPVFRFPDVFARIAGGVTGLFGSAENAGWRLPPWACAAGLYVLAALAAAYLLALFRAAKQSGLAGRVVAAEDAAEVALLYLVFAVANPVLAVGIYFCFWHGLRHIGRLLLLDETSRSLCVKGKVVSAFARFGWQCLPILLLSLLMLAGAYGWAVRVGAGSGAPGGLSVYLALISCLTFPHFLLVCWLDRQDSQNN